jgi:HD-GYP domain-containing protein (c-di-GMP phosphodiesterase class II)
MVVQQVRQQAQTRWQGRPIQATGLRVLAVAIPVAAGVVASTVLSRLLAYPEGWALVVLWWTAVLSVSTLVVALVDRQARRLLPLAALLKLSMVFPDKAPSRFGTALRAGSVRNLEDRVAEMRARGAADEEPSRAAGRILELVGALSVHDRGTRGHAERVRAYSDLLGLQIGLTEDERDKLRWASLLHDVGKVAVPTEILNKAGAPDESEWAVIHRHPEEGGRLAAPLRAWLGEWADTIEQHHERWDGLGYPHHLAGEEICRGARIVAVADAFEVMTAARSYKRPMDVKAARAELTAGAGSQFDPTMVRAFLMISIGQMRWISGPLAWFAQLPFLQGVTGVAGQAAAIGGRVLAGAALFAGIAGPAVSANGADGPDVHAPAAATTVTTTVAGPNHGAPGGAPGTAVGSVAPKVGPVAPPVAPRTAAPVVATTTTRPNVPPIAGADSATTTQHKPVVVAVLGNDVDPDSNGLVVPVSLAVVPAHGNANPQSSGTVLYVPYDQYVGPDSFVYRVCDTRGACVTASVSINVLPDPTATTPTTAKPGGGKKGP